MTSLDNPQDGIRLTPDQMKRRRQRNIAIGASLLALVVLFYAITLAKLGVGMFNRPL